jgi:hypothetical protein
MSKSVSSDLQVYVVDTGNCRIKMLTEELSLVRQVECEEGLQGRSCTGIAAYSHDTSPWIVTINWRTKLVTR